MPQLISLPGNLSKFDLAAPIVPGGNFTWGEATHGGTRIPGFADEVRNIIQLAKQLQPVREKINKPFHVTSWYRPEPFNSAAGGVSNSQHLHGKAVDFWVEGYTGHQLRELIDAEWNGGLGIYPHFPYLIHLDVGANRRW